MAPLFFSQVVLAMGVTPPPTLLLHAPRLARAAARLAASIVRAPHLKKKTHVWRPVERPYVMSRPRAGPRQTVTHLKAETKTQRKETSLLTL
jgi:hypothetical protein